MRMLHVGGLVSKRNGSNVLQVTPLRFPELNASFYLDEQGSMLTADLITVLSVTTLLSL